MGLIKELRIPSTQATQKSVKASSQRIPGISRVARATPIVRPNQRNMS